MFLRTVAVLGWVRLIFCICPGVNVANFALLPVARRGALTFDGRVRWVPRVNVALGPLSGWARVWMPLCSPATRVYDVSIKTHGYKVKLPHRLSTADRNLPNSSNVEVEVTPPMNGSVGHEGEAVSKTPRPHEG